MLAIGKLVELGKSASTFARHVQKTSQLGLPPVLFDAKRQTESYQFLSNRSDPIGGTNPKFAVSEALSTQLTDQ